MVNPDRVRTLFETETRNLLEMISRTDLPSPDSELLDFTSLKHPDVLRTQVDPAIPGEEIVCFDYPYRDRVLKFADAWLDSWDNLVIERNVSPSDETAMMHLFLLHEFFHTNQNLTSYRYRGLRNDCRAVMAIDYLADAQSILTAFLLYRYNRPNGWTDAEMSTEWNRGVARLIVCAINVMMVFRRQLDADEFKKQTNTGNFHRLLTWHFQYTRIIEFLPEFHSLTDIALMEEPAISLEYEAFLQPSVKWNPLDTFPEQLKLLFVMQKRIHHFTSDTSEFIKKLMEGVFCGDVVASKAAFGAVFQEFPHLVGRGQRVDESSASQLTTVSLDGYPSLLRRKIRTASRVSVISVTCAQVQREYAKDIDAMLEQGGELRLLTVEPSKRVFKNVVFFGEPGNNVDAMILNLKLIIEALRERWKKSAAEERCVFRQLRHVPPWRAIIVERVHENETFVLWHPRPLRVTGSEFPVCLFDGLESQAFIRYFCDQFEFLWNLKSTEL